jgi:sortase A
VIGILRIPRLDISGLVLEGTTGKTLRRGIGHVTSTPLPHQSGNVGLSAHRDTFFRRLGEIRVGDRLSIATPHGLFRYRVEVTAVTEPQNVAVLDDLGYPALTLITCFPFRYIGPAPQRYVVWSRLEAVQRQAGSRDQFPQ